MVSWNNDARICLQTQIFKQIFHYHLDNFISFPLIYRWCPIRINKVTYGKLETALKVNGNLKRCQVLLLLLFNNQGNISFLE